MEYGEDEDDDENDDNSDAEVTPTSSRNKRVRVDDSSKGKKPKTTRGNWIVEEIGRMSELNERATISCESIARSVVQKAQSGYSISEVMALVKDCGATPGTDEHFIATTLFTKKAEREMFMTLETREERLAWLSKKYQWVVSMKP